MLTIWSPGWRPARSAGLPGISDETFTGVGCILGTKPSVSGENSSGLVAVEATKKVVSTRWPSCTYEKGTVWLRFSRQWLPTSSQVGFSTLSKWTMVSPEWMPVLATGLAGEM